MNESLQNYGYLLLSLISISLPFLLISRVHVEIKKVNTILTRKCHLIYTLSDIVLFRYIPKNALTDTFSYQNNHSKFSTESTTIVVGWRL